MTDESGSEDYVSMEYELPFVVDGAADHFAPHRHLFDRLDLDLNDTVLIKIFRILAGLCDPMTQPEDSDDLPLSVDLLARLAIALSYEVVLRSRKEEEPRPWEKVSETKHESEEHFNQGDFDNKSEIIQLIPTVEKMKSPITSKESQQTDKISSILNSTTLDIETIRFQISTKFHIVVIAITKAIRADDELRVRYLQNDWKNWTNTSAYWLPYLEQDLKLAYYIYPVAIMGLYRLFLPPNEADYNPALNPYSETFIRLWKTHTNIVALALEMDRELEEEAWNNKNDSVDTPDLIKRVLLGSSAVRTVLAWILERTQPSGDESIVSTLLDDDVRNKTLLSFYDPLARSTANCGSVNSDQHLLMTAILILRCRSSFSPYMKDDGYFKMIPFPCFDQVDLRRRAWSRLDPLLSTGDLVMDMYYHDQFDEDVKYVFGYYDSGEDNDSGRSSVADSHARRGIAIRATGDEEEFDEEGRDWRDCPRGENVNFTEEFLNLEKQVLQLSKNGELDYFFATWFELNQALEFLAFTQIESVDSFMIRVGQVAIDSIAKAVKDENSNSESKIVIKEIYRYLVSTAKFELLLRAAEDFSILSLHPITNFEVILMRNPYCALAILDELFMCKGLRRSLIWFLTSHVNPLITLISYMYEFVSGLRGNNSARQIKYSFSREGPLILLKMEQLMILHELFSAADKWVSNDGDDTNVSELYCVRLITYLCLMIKKLLYDGVIRSDQDDVYEDYSHEIQLLLFSWIGKVPEAREIFFKIKLDKYGTQEGVDAAESKTAQLKTAQLKIIEPDNSYSKNSQLKNGHMENSALKSAQFKPRLNLQDLNSLEKDPADLLPYPMPHTIVREDEIGIMREFDKNLQSLKDEDNVLYVLKSLAPEMRDNSVKMAEMLMNRIGNIDLKRDLVHAQATDGSSRTIDEFDIFQYVLVHYNELYRNTAFVDALVDGFSGWIINNRVEKVEKEEQPELVEEEQEELESKGPAEAESEFSDAFLNGEEQFENQTNEKKTKKKYKKKRRGKK